MATPIKSPFPCGRRRGVTFKVVLHPYPNPFPSMERGLLAGFYLYSLDELSLLMSYSTYLVIEE